MPFLQDLIHKLELGGGMRHLRAALAVLVVAALAMGYNWRGFKNFSTQEAMDAAQLARNLAEGRGYTTFFVRPYSIHLLKKHHPAAADAARLKQAHPDLANPPVYPCLLAGLMKVIPFDYKISTSTKSFWSAGTRFLRYKPDFVIGLLNQALFLCVALLVFLLARKLFDPRVAWFSTILLLATELMWRFSVSGLSTMLLILMFVGMCWCLVVIEDTSRATPPRHGKALVFAVFLGVLVGLGSLTRYSFCLLLLPTLAFILVFGGSRRLVLAGVVLILFSGIFAPWLVRNYNLSGTPFGTSSFAVMENTVYFPEHRLQRSLAPDFARIGMMPLWIKLITNSRQILTELPKLGGSWVSALFVVGLLVGFRNPSIKRLRYFLVAAICILIVTQAAGKTQLSEDSPEINSENLLIFVYPLTLMFGIGLFFLLIDQIHFPLPQVRYATIGLFGIVVSLPLVFNFLPPRPVTVAYPPYYPPAIQTVAGYLKPHELAMSDIPWAVAWYGQRQCVWLTLNAQKDYFEIHDYQKPISLLYLTPVTMDNRFLSQWIKAGEQSWGSFILESMVKSEVPPSFPLRKAPKGWLPEQLVLTDWERWRKPGE